MYSLVQSITSSWNKSIYEFLNKKCNFNSSSSSFKSFNEHSSLGVNNKLIAITHGIQATHLTWEYIISYHNNLIRPYLSSRFITLSHLPRIYNHFVRYCVHHTASFHRTWSRHALIFYQFFFSKDAGAYSRKSVSGVRVDDESPGDNSKSRRASNERGRKML